MLPWLITNAKDGREADDGRSQDSERLTVVTCRGVNSLIRRCQPLISLDYENKSPIHLNSATSDQARRLVALSLESELSINPRVRRRQPIFLSL